MTFKNKIIKSHDFDYIIFYSIGNVMTFSNPDNIILKKS